MQWLNKVDDALDWVLGPQAKDGDDENTGDGSAIAAAAAAFLGELPKTASFAGYAPDGHTVGDNNAKNELFSIRVAKIGLANENTTTPRPPPPPPRPPPPKTGSKSEISPPQVSPTKRAHHLPDACPSTPLLAVAGEHLVIDESPYPAYDVVNYAGNAHRNTLNGKLEVGCNRQPSDFTEDAADAITPIRGEADIMSQPPDQIPHTEDIIEQSSPLLAQMQNFARASPAPTKVTIGDREIATPSRPFLNMHSDNLTMLSEKCGIEDDDVDDEKTKSITQREHPPRQPPLPPPFYQDTSERPRQTLHNKPRVPPSVIQVPNSQHQHQPSPIKWVPPLPLGPPPPNSQNSARAPATRAIHRPTPGVIRRKLREPSLSPPQSPTQSWSSNDVAKKEYRSAPESLPPFVPSCVEVALTATTLSNEVKEDINDSELAKASAALASDLAMSTLTSEYWEENFPINVPVAVTQGEEKKGVVRKIEADDDGGSFSNDSFHSQSSSDSELTESNELDDFAVPLPTLSQIEDDNNSTWDPSLNRYGFFHVRLIRAQRLPCTSGSVINATLSLQPWNGRIRIPAHITVNGPVGAGVCLRWDKSSHQKRPGSNSGSSKDRESIDKEAVAMMVHAYNNPETPVPAIFLELRSSFRASLGGVFDRFLCSISVPCHDLLRNPRSWKRQWFPASGSSETEIVPLVLLEACFEPKVTRLTGTKISSQAIMEGETEVDDSDLFNISGDSDRPGSVPLIIRPTRRGLVDDDSISKSSSLTPALIPRGSTVTKSHLLRVRSFWTPTWCSVCSRPIINRWVQGFECEACHIICCRDCQLQVDARILCGSEIATIAVREAQKYQVPSFSQIMTTIAPHLDMEKATLRFGSEGRPTEQKSGLSNFRRSIDGIGVMNVRILRACLFDKTFPPEAEPIEIFESDFNLRNGDHYVRVSWLGSKESKRTKTVLQTSKPFFDSEEMAFDVPHYGMEYKLEVVDANTDKAIGSCLLSAQGLLQWQRDDIFASTDRTLLSFFHLRKYSELRRVKLELRTGVKNGFGLNFYNSSMSAGDPNKGKEYSQRPGEITGWLEIDVHLEEDRQLFYSTNPRRISRPEEEFDINVIQLHIARITAIVESLKKVVSTYFYVVSWENQELTGAFVVRSFLSLTLQMIAYRTTNNNQHSSTRFPTLLR